MKIEIIKEFIQPANINFLVGSGLSRPYLETLGNIEELLTSLSSKEESSDINVYNLVKGSIYKEYFVKIIKPNLSVEKEANDVIGDCCEVNNNYVTFLNILNQIIHNRGGSILSKQINIYTTNIDTFFENAAELSKVEFNDGFKGSVPPTYDEGNFNKSYLKNSVHFQNITELPVFNLLKMHGSINWHSVDGAHIYNDTMLKLVGDISHQLCLVEGDVPFINMQKSIDMDGVVKYTNKNIEELWAEAKTSLNDNRIKVKQRLKTFFDEYEKLIMVNPTKKKFSETVLDLHFYELLRMFSNSLEKENSILFVMGFSFADEHILSITKRAIMANPTLVLIIFAFSDADAKDYEEKFLNIINVKIISPKSFNEINNLEDDKISNFNFANINQVFKQILNLIPINFNYGRK